MEKPKINYLVDFFSFVFFVLTAFSGLVIFFFLPSGLLRGGIQEFWGMNKRFWVDFHQWTGILFFVLVAVHFALHWEWIVCMTKNIFKLDSCEVEAGKDNASSPKNSPQKDN